MESKKFFDRIIVISLPHRHDRRSLFSAQMFHHGIPYETFDAIRMTNGADGIYHSMIKLFTKLLEDKVENALIFEDDSEFLLSPISFDHAISRCIEQLPPDYDMLHLGANLPNKHLVEYFSINLLKVKRALALHAVIYSRRGMEKILSLPKMLPIDLQIANFIHPAGHCYCSMPMLVGQRAGYSDIEKRFCDNSVFIQDRYNNLIKDI